MNKTQAQGKAIRKQSYPNDPPGYSKMVRRLEGEGATTSDAQAVADVHFRNHISHLVSERDTAAELRKEHNYWRDRKGKKNLKIYSSPSSEKGIYNTRIMEREK